MFVVVANPHSPAPAHQNSKAASTSHCYCANSTAIVTTLAHHRRQTRAHRCPSMTVEKEKRRDNLEAPPRRRRLLLMGGSKGCGGGDSLLRSLLPWRILVELKKRYGVLSRVCGLEERSDCVNIWLKRWGGYLFTEKRAMVDPVVAIARSLLG